MHRKMQIWSHLLKKSLMENFIFYAVIKTPDFLLFLRLTGVETSESVSQNFKRKFHFLFLVSVAVDKLTAM